MSGWSASCSITAPIRIGRHISAPRCRMRAGTTASGGKTVAATFKGLRPGGVSIVLGVGPEPIETSSLDLIFGSRKLEGALTGDPATADATLRFSALSGVSAMIETVALDQAANAYAKMMAGKARFRIVLTMDRWSRKE